MLLPRPDPVRALCLRLLEDAEVELFMIRCALACYALETRGGASALVAGRKTPREDQSPAQFAALRRSVNLVQSQWNRLDPV